MKQPWVFEREYTRRTTSWFAIKKWNNLKHHAPLHRKWLFPDRWGGRGRLRRMGDWAGCIRLQGCSTFPWSSIIRWHIHLYPHHTYIQMDPLFDQQSSHSYTTHALACSALHLSECMHDVRCLHVNQSGTVWLVVMVFPIAVLFLIYFTNLFLNVHFTFN